MALVTRPIELNAANEFVSEHHRHHPPAVGHRFSIGAFDGERLCGVLIAGRSVGRFNHPLEVLEVTRLASDGTRNACSLLYGAAARAGRALGYERIQTFTLPSEGGASLRASGWVNDGEQRRSGKGWQTRAGREPNQHTDQISKWRWSKILNHNGPYPTPVPAPQLQATLL